MSYLTKTKKQLIDMYINCLKEKQIPWKKRWKNNLNFNGISKKEYKGVNQLLLTFVSNEEKYDDPRWYTFVQIKKQGWKLRKEAKGKGVPIEFMSYYNFSTKKRLTQEEYEKHIEKYPEEKDHIKIIFTFTYVYNATYIEGVPEYKNEYLNKKIPIPQYISNVMKNIGVKYEEKDGGAYYNAIKDMIVLPKSKNFKDEYSYYATLLHEICHATGNKKS